MRFEGKKPRKKCQLRVSRKNFLEEIVGPCFFLGFLARSFHFGQSCRHKAHERVGNAGGRGDGSRLQREVIGWFEPLQYEAWHRHHDVVAAQHHHDVVAASHRQHEVVAASRRQHEVVAASHR